MTAKNNEEIIQNKLQEVETNLSRVDYFDHYILETLNSFSYRYFDEPMLSEMIAPNLFRVTAIEKGIKEAIKIKNPELRTGISELVKRVSKAEGPTILRELKVHLTQRDPSLGGQCLLCARISFGHPHHDFSILWSNTSGN